MAPRHPCAASPARLTNRASCPPSASRTMSDPCPTRPYSGSVVEGGAKLGLQSHLEGSAGRDRIFGRRDRNTAPARINATRCGPLTARHRSWAASISLNAIAMPAALEPGPLVILVSQADGKERRLDRVGGLRWIQCSAEKSKKHNKAAVSLVGDLGHRLGPLGSELLGERLGRPSPHGLGPRRRGSRPAPAGLPVAPTWAERTGRSPRRAPSSAARGSRARQPSNTRSRRRPVTDWRSVPAPPASSSSAGWSPTATAGRWARQASTPILARLESSSPI